MTTRVVVFLILGAVVNVAVAWDVVSASLCERGGLGNGKGSPNGEVHVAVALGCASFIRPDAFTCDGTSAEGRRLWMAVFGEQEFGSIDGDWVCLDSGDLGLEWCTEGLGVRTLCLNRPSRHVLVQKSGWPTLALQKREVGGLEEHHVLLPLRPIWPGFAINTVFYAAILWALFAMSFVVRRRRRVRRGLCAGCAYPVGTSDVCTECGAPFGTRSLRHSVTS
jgi:hypothetical protein